jgi:hypothetical protein
MLKFVARFAAKRSKEETLPADAGGRRVCGGLAAGGACKSYRGNRAPRSSEERTTTIVTCNGRNCSVPRTDSRPAHPAGSPEQKLITTATEPRSSNCTKCKTQKVNEAPYGPQCAFCYKGSPRHELGLYCSMCGQQLQWDSGNKCGCCNHSVHTSSAMVECVACRQPIVDLNVRQGVVRCPMSGCHKLQCAIATRAPTAKSAPGTRGLYVTVH